MSPFPFVPVFFWRDPALSSPRVKKNMKTSQSFADARLEEIKLLSEIDRSGSWSLAPEKGPFRDLMAFLVDERLVNDLHLDWPREEGPQSHGLPGETLLERRLHAERVEAMRKVLAGEVVHFTLTHRGRVRLSELKQAVRGNREREPFGILWDVRHWERDTQIAILESQKSTPLAVVYTDMNGRAYALKLTRIGVGNQHFFEKLGV
jgi:hypothetical protein